MSSDQDESDDEQDPICRHWGDRNCDIDCVICLHPCYSHPYDGGEYCLVAGCDCEQFKDVEN